MSKEKLVFKKGSSKKKKPKASSKELDNNLPQHKTLASRRLWPVYMASIATILWISGIGYLAFLQGLFTSGEAISISDFAIFAAGLTSPVVVFWLIALVYQRTDPLLERRIEVATGMEKTLDPINTAEDRLKEISANISKQIDFIEASTDIAVQRIENLENRFQDQVNELYTATTDAEAKGANLKDMLTREREAMENYTEELEIKIKGVESSMRRITGLVEDAVTSIKSETIEAGETFQEQATNSREEYEIASQHLENIGKTLSHQSDEITATSKDVRDQMEEMFESIMAHAGNLAREIDKIEVKGRGLGIDLEKQAKTLSKISKEAVKHAEKFETAVVRQTDKLSSVATGALSQAAQAGEEFEKQAKTIEKVASDTLQRTEDIFVEAGRGIANSSAAAETSAQVAAEAAFQHINKATDAIEALSATMEASAQKATAETVSNIKNLQDGLSEQARIIQETTTTNSSQLEGATQKLADHAEMIATAAQKTAEGLLQAGDAMDERGNNLGQVLDETKRRLIEVETDLNKQRTDLADTAEQSLTILSDAANQFDTNADKLHTKANTIADDLMGHSDKIKKKIKKLGKMGDLTSTLFVSASKKLRDENKEFGNSIKMNLGRFADAAETFGVERDKFMEESTETIQKLDLGTQALIQGTSLLVNSSEAGAERMNILTKKISTASKAADENAEIVLSKVKSSVEETKAGIKSSLDNLQTKAQEDMANIQLRFSKLIAASSNSLAKAHKRANEDAIATVENIAKSTEKLIGSAELFINQSTEFNKKLK